MTEKNKELLDGIIIYVKKYFSVEDANIISTKLDVYFQEDYKLLFFQISQEENKPKFEIAFRHLKTLLDYTYCDKYGIICTLPISKISFVSYDNTTLKIHADNKLYFSYMASSEKVKSLLNLFHNEVQKILQEEI